MAGIFDIFRRVSRRRPTVPGPVQSRRRKRREALSLAETLERRSMLAVTVTPNGSILDITFTGSDNSVYVEFDTFSNGATPPVVTLGVQLSIPGTPQTRTFGYVTDVRVTVTDPSTVSNNRVSFGISPFGGAFDLSSFIFEGNGASGAGFFSCKTSELRAACALTVSDVDILSFSQAREIRLDGTFTNDTDDATIEVATQSLNPTVTEVILGTNRPLEADFIRIESSKAITFFNPVSAAQDLTLRTAAALNLDYDVTAGGTLVLDGTGGVTQVASSRVQAATLELVNRAAATATEGTGNVVLGTVTNDFDEIRITSETAGQVAIRDVDDLVIGESGIRAAAGQTVIEVLGALSINAPVRAAGFTARSGSAITTSAAAPLELGSLGVQLYATDTFDPSATGSITVNAPVRIQPTAAADVANNKIVAAGAASVLGGYYAPFGGSTTFSGAGGVVVGGPVQVGSSQLNATSTTLTVYDHDLLLVSTEGDIEVRDVPGNDAIPRTIQATNIVSFDAAGGVKIAGSVLAGTIYGNPLSLAETKALPAITIVAGGTVDLTTTGSLQTSTYENNAGQHPNPTLGLVSIAEADQVNLNGRVTADGAVKIDVLGDIYLYGPLTARESITAATTTGSVDVQGAVRATGGSYSTSLTGTLLEQRTPHVTLSAPTGSVTTGGLGTLRAGTMTSGGTTTYGEVRMTAQQDIVLGAAVDTDGGLQAVTTLGAVAINALLRTAGGKAATVSAASGITESTDGRIVTASLDLTNTTSGDISLLAADNRIDAITARNLVVGGKIQVASDSATKVGILDADGAIGLTVDDDLTVATLVRSNADAVALASTGGDVSLEAGSVVHAVAGGVTIDAAQGALAVAGDVYAETSAALAAAQTVTISGLVQSVTGNVALESDAGNVFVQPSGDIVVDAPSGSITIDAPTGLASVGNVQAGDDITITTLGSITLLGTVQAKTGDITGISRNGGITVSAVIRAEGGAVDLQSNDRLTSRGGGISRIDVISGGAFYTFAVVTVAAPASGTGRAALARANISNGSIASISILDPGYGYAIDEQAAVTIVGNEARTETDVVTDPDGKTQVVNKQIPAGAGGTAIATATSFAPSITAKTDVSLSVRGDITVTSDIATGTGAILMASQAGDIAAESLAAGAGGIAVTANAGSVSVGRFTAEGKVEIVAATDVTATFGIESKASSVSIQSRAGDVDLSNAGVVVSAGESVTLVADSGLVRTPATLVAQDDVTIAGHDDVTLNNTVTSLGGDVSSPARRATSSRTPW